MKVGSHVDTTKGLGTVHFLGTIKGSPKDDWVGIELDLQHTTPFTFPIQTLIYFFFLQTLTYFFFHSQPQQHYCWHAVLKDSNSFKANI